MYTKADKVNITLCYICKRGALGGGECDDFQLVSHFPPDLLAQIHWCQAFSPKSHITKQRHTKVEVNEHCHVQYL